MKIIINTNSNYRQHLIGLFKSILRSDFNNFEDLIIVDSQVTPTSPEYRKLSEIVDLGCEREVIYVGVEHNSFDYAGFNALYLYRNNPLIQDEMYFYLHDTCEVQKDWYNKVIQFDDPIYYDKLIMYDRPSSNIVAFGKNLVDYYDDMFDMSFTKMEAIGHECDDAVEVDGKIYSTLYINANDIILNLGKRIGSTRPVRNRRKFIYPHFGIVKYISQV